MARGFRDEDDSGGRNTNVKVLVELIVTREMSWGIDAGKGIVFVPKSQCEVGRNRKGEMEFEGPEWLAIEKGLV